VIPAGMENNVKTRYLLYLALGLVLAATIAGLFPSLSNHWVEYDDDRYVLHNVFIRDLTWQNIKGMFLRTEFESLIPLVYLSYAFDWALWKEEAFGYHLTNLIFHIINSLLVFALIMKLSRKNLLASFVGSILFAVHPLHVESVAWIAERKDQVVAFFYIQTIIYYLFFLDKRKWYYYFLTVVAFIAALLSKPMAVTIPAVLVLCDWRDEGRLRLRRILSKIPLFVLSAAVAALTMVFQKGSIGAGQRRPFGLVSFLVACKGYLTYLWKTLLPIKLSVLYPFPENVSLESPEYFLPPIILAGVFLLLYKIRRKNRDVVFYLLFFFIAMLPVIQLVPVGMHFIADRYYYIPSIGLLALAGIGFAKLLGLCKERRFLKSLAAAFLSAVIGVFSFLSFKRCAVWKGPLSLWRDVAVKFPDYHFAHTRLGEECLKKAASAVSEDDRRQYLQKAMGEFQESLRLAPNNFLGLVGLGRTYCRMKKYQKAQALSIYARKTMPDSFEGYVNLAALHEELKEYGLAAERYSEAIKLAGDVFVLYEARGRCYLGGGKYEKAVEDFSKALSLEPRSMSALNSLGAAYIELKDYEAAAGVFRKMVRRDPENVQAYLNLAYVYQERGKFEQAIRLCRMLIESGAWPILAYERLGKIYVAMKEYPKARECFEKALELNPPPPRKKTIQQALDEIKERG